MHHTARGTDTDARTRTMNLYEDSKPKTKRRKKKTTTKLQLLKSERDYLPLRTAYAAFRKEKKKVDESAKFDLCD